MIFLKWIMKTSCSILRISEYPRRSSRKVTTNDEWIRWEGRTVKSLNSDMLIVKAPTTTTTRIYKRNRPSNQKSIEIIIENQFKIGPKGQYWAVGKSLSIEQTLPRCH
jgi:hypothetical protein